MNSVNYRLKFFFKKDISYEHEKEYRFILFDKNGASQIPIKPVHLDNIAFNKKDIDQLLKTIKKVRY